MVTHEGPDRKSGHFRAFVRADNKVWYLLDDETVKMTSLESLQSKFPAYFMVYQKEGSAELAAKSDASKQKFEKTGSIIEQNVKEMENKKKADQDRFANPMIEFESLDEGNKIPEETNLKKRRPFVRLRDPKAQLLKMNIFAERLPEVIQDEAKITKKLDLKGLEKKSAKAGAWNEEMAEMIDDFSAMNRFMLGKIERKRDQYDVEYDMGKVKKVKKKKAVQKFNFDKQAKKIQKREASGDKKFKKRR